MELKQDSRCYTDVCVDGKWFHHDHGTTQAYMLKGGAHCSIELNKLPLTESELIELINAQL
ncbi:hypothetical protein FCU94_13915 [Vibrio sp. JPW-9-11-11]|jgi:hypothetical protein|uniref:hypothetical protein n=1 Tax=Vibrio sp. JPW-9-11-11 TaxID=1416532 RepID=UPI001593767E|nr:hypothetical protein [Vibrio sp. JPW-9-11-11]NVD07984.1 hypothetical protein [Vibrio sp. JPW-9-11-11]